MGAFSLMYCCKKIDKSLILLLAIAALLNIAGLKWGIPSSQIQRFFYTGKENIPRMQSDISHQYIQESWRIAKESKPEEKIPRSVFNAIRSLHPDEHNIIKSISNMKPRQFNFNPHFFEYPSFFIYFVALLLGIASILGVVRITYDISYYFLHPDEMGRLFLTGRIGVVILSVLGVLFLYKAVENFFDRKTAFFSAFFLTVTPLYVINSHFMTVDIPMVFWIIFSIYLLSLFWKKDDIRFVYLSALTMGFAAGTKYPAAFIFFFVPLVYGSKKQLWKKLVFFESVKTFLLMLTGFFLTTPYSIFAFSECKRDVFFQVGTRGFGTGVRHLSGHISSFLYNTSIVLESGFSNTFYFLFCAGVIYALFNKGKSRIFLTGLILSIIPLFITGGVRYARYYLIILPFAAIIAGLFLACITDIVKFRIIQIFVSGLIAMTFLIPFLKSLSYSLHMSKEDIRITTSGFIESHIPEGTTIVFTRDPWIFEMPPVNSFKYNVAVVSQENLDKMKEGSYLITGELQYFLTYGSRKRQEKDFIEDIERYGCRLEGIFKKTPQIFNLSFDTDVTTHDMIYTHPAIYLFKKT
jgi:hypothetical protein